jgi:hypothetical protein
MKFTKLFQASLVVTGMISSACGYENNAEKTNQKQVAPPKGSQLADKNDNSNSSQKDNDSEFPEFEGNDSVTLEPPEGFEPDTHLTMEFFRWETPPKSVGDFPHAPREMTEEEGRALFFKGILPLVNEANTPSPTESEFGLAIAEGMIVGPACATTNSQVLEYAARKADLDWIAEIFENPWGYLPTHNNEYQFMLLGWHYYLMDDYISPAGSMGAWTRYTFYGTPDHTGHIYVTFKDMGANTSPLVGDNTRLSNELHGHLYRPAGRPVGFWLPPGVYPKKRSGQ